MPPPAGRGLTSWFWSQICRQCALSLHSSHVDGRRENEPEGTAARSRGGKQATRRSDRPGSRDPEQRPSSFQGHRIMSNVPRTRYRPDGGEEGQADRPGDRMPVGRNRGCGGRISAPNAKSGLHSMNCAPLIFFVHSVSFFVFRAPYHI